MAIEHRPLNCQTCGQTHLLEIDFDRLTDRQRLGLDPLIDTFVCDRVARLYRVISFAIDTRVRVFLNDDSISQRESIAAGLAQQWGSHNFDRKLDRFKRLNLSLLGVPDEYYELLKQIINAYCCGHFYPAMTSSGALGERVLNRLILRTRDHFKCSPLYKRLYNKNSFDNWDLPIEALHGWAVISDAVAEQFRKLKVHRNDSIHYRDGYDFELNAHDAVSEIATIVNRQFGMLMRDDLYWLFQSPGEIFVRSTRLSDPFVKEFVLPHCVPITAFCEAGAPGRNAPLAPLSDEDFLQARVERQKTR